MGVTVAVEYTNLEDVLKASGRRIKMPGQSNPSGTNPKSTKPNLSFGMVEYDVVDCLKKNGSIPLGQLLRRIHWPPTMVTTSVNHLLKDGTIQEAPKKGTEISILDRVLELSEEDSKVASIR